MQNVLSVVHKLVHAAADSVWCRASCGCWGHAEGVAPQQTNSQRGGGVATCSCGRSAMTRGRWRHGRVWLAFSCLCEARSTNDKLGVPAREAAQSCSVCYVCGGCAQVFGRRAGFIALQSSLASGAVDICLIPGGGLAPGAWLSGSAGAVCSVAADRSFP